MERGVTTKHGETPRNHESTPRKDEEPLKAEQHQNRVLIVIDGFYPGYRIGGPQRTIENIIDYYGKESNIFVYTRNHDVGIDEPYIVENNKWITYKQAHVMYVPDNYYSEGLTNMYDCFDIVYACGLFAQSTISLLIIHKKKNKQKRVYIAPMGVLDDGAYKSKQIKKIVFLKLFKTMGMFNNIVWSFTSEIEFEYAKKRIGVKHIKNHVIAEDMPQKVDFDYYRTKVSKNGNEILRICFISRICSKKNLLEAIIILNQKYEKSVRFDIYGLIEDSAYWEDCRLQMGKLPEGISACYCGELTPEDVTGVFAEYDLFLFPTKGENYGHVIFESLAVGCLPIVSDNTPWQDLDDNNVGRVIRSREIGDYRDAIHNYCMYSTERWLLEKRKAIDYAEKKYIASVKNNGYRTVFL